MDLSDHSTLFHLASVHLSLYAFDILSDDQAGGMVKAWFKICSDHGCNLYKLISYMLRNDDKLFIEQGLVEFFQNQE